MSKLFIFGIGGTGSRVLRALTMILASGVKIGADEIVPIIIDPDTSNADLTRTISLLNKYTAIRSKLNFNAANQNGFFRTEIKRILPNYTLEIKDTANKSFQQFIDFASMDRANKALTKMLFSDENLHSSMEVGFKGNPNIGSVVLNQIAHSEDFQTFANEFSEGDSIFIISSIFGGTGASGFPLLLKTLRNDKDLLNHDIINHAPIGAITVLPYFKLKQDESSEIDSSTFISKAKSALAYYESNIIGNGSINALYYLADDIGKTYDNHEGGSAQQNDAHLIEFLAATAIVDFSAGTDYEAANLELGIKEDAEVLTFNSFHQKLRGMLYNPMVQFTLMANALTHRVDRFKSNSFNANKGNFEDMYTSAFFNDLTEFFRKYHEWLKEMQANKRSLGLFNLSCGDKAFDLVEGVKPKRKWALRTDYDSFISRLNAVVSKRDCMSLNKENLFLEMFFLATQRLVKDKLSN